MRCASKKRRHKKEKRGRGRSDSVRRGQSRTDKRKEKKGFYYPSRTSRLHDREKKGN